MNNILPVNRTKKQAQKYYDRISGFYDWLAASEKQFINAGIAMVAALPGERILEIGSGTGTGLAKLANDLAGQGLLVGLDLSRQMLLKSHQKIKGEHHPCLLIQGDGAHIPIRDGFFNGVFCAFTLELFAKDEISVVLTQIKRVLKKDGRLVVVSLADKPRNLPVKLYEFAHQGLPVMIDCRPIPLLEILEQHGFVVLENKKVPNWGLPIQIALSRQSYD